MRMQRKKKIILITDHRMKKRSQRDADTSDPRRWTIAMLLASLPNQNRNGRQRHNRHAQQCQKRKDDPKVQDLANSSNQKRKDHKLRKSTVHMMMKATYK